MKGWIIVGALAVGGIATNAAVWRSMRNPAADDHGLWGAMETVKVPDRPEVPPVFPDEIRSQDGKRVSLSGVAFLMKSGVEDGQVRWCVLMPPSRYGCCGVSCNPRPEMSVYVDCSRLPWAAAGRQQLMAQVEGTLRLDRGAGSWCLYTLEDASVRPIEP